MSKAGRGDNLKKGGGSSRGCYLMFSAGHGLVEAERVFCGVGILELENAVSGGGAEADIQPVGEVGGGLDFVGLSGSAGELQEYAATRAFFDGGVFGSLEFAAQRHY